MPPSIASVETKNVRVAPRLINVDGLDRAVGCRKARLPWKVQECTYGSGIRYSLSRSETALLDPGERVALVVRERSAQLLVVVRRVVKGDNAERRCQTDSLIFNLMAEGALDTAEYILRSVMESA